MAATLRKRQAVISPFRLGIRIYYFRLLEEAVVAAAAVEVAAAVAVALLPDPHLAWLSREYPALMLMKFPVAQ